MNARKLFAKALFSAVCTFFAAKMQANNLRITETAVDVAASTVTFKIAWDNSWYSNAGAPNNWDGVWVFVKNQNCATRLWAHTNLSATSSDHSTSAPLQVDAVTDGKGVFVRRAAPGGGNIAETTVTLKMTGLNTANTYNFKVYGIEMVNVPQGAFKIGDATITGAFNEMDVTSDGAITAAALGGTPASGNIPVAYPTGFNSFYAMKYEISQEQYVDFLNALTYDQQKAHTVTDPISAAGTWAMYTGKDVLGKNGIKISTPGANNAIPAVYSCDATPGVENNINDGQNIAMNYLKWDDVAAYLDWSALRPMTELEFEKLCRGAGQPRVAGEYPWGTIDLQYVEPAKVLNLLRPDEKYNTAVYGLCNYGYTGYYQTLSYNNPLRVGFSATASSGRASSGAAYYGAMQMGGNVTELVINTTPNGAVFLGNLGDGTLAANGAADTTSWPAGNSVAVGERGGSLRVDGWNWSNNGTEVRTSDRSRASMDSSSRTVDKGGRGVR